MDSYQGVIIQVVANIIQYRNGGNDADQIYSKSERILKVFKNMPYGFCSIG